MIYRERPIAPTCLTETTRHYKKYGNVQNQVAWGLQYEAKRNDTSKSNDFAWATFKGKKVSQLIEDDLKDMTQNHCAFCDFFPLRGRTIEHFKPKGQFPKESYLWENLFFCCGDCQKKGERYDISILKPDIEGFEFDKYFICQFDGEAILMKPNPRAATVDQRRSEITIELYGLNHFGQPEDRYRAWRQYLDSKNPIIDEFPYRFLFL